MAQLADRYALENVLRDDGAGTVHEGSDKKSGDRVLVSRATSDSLSEARERLEALVEARVVQRASSPALARLRGGGHDESTGDVYLVQALVEGESLDARLAAEPALTVEQAIRLVAELLGGLGALHRHGLSHGDVCPHNVIVLERLGGVTPRLIHLAVNAAPFRAARAAWADELELASLAYASPEQASREELASPSSDVYSAASVLYAMLSGRAPFAGHDERSLRREVAAGDVESLGAHAPFAGSELASVLDRALHPDRSARFAKADELQQTLRKTLLTLGQLRTHPLPVGARFQPAPAEGSSDPAEAPSEQEDEGFFSAEDWAGVAPDSIVPPPREVKPPAVPVTPEPAPEVEEDAPALELDDEGAEPAAPARRLYAPVDPAEFGLDDDDEEEEESTRVGVVSEALLQTMRDLDDPEPGAVDDDDEEEEEQDEPTRARVVQPEMLELLEREDGVGAAAAGEPADARAPEDSASEGSAIDDSASEDSAIEDSAIEDSASEDSVVGSDAASDAEARAPLATSLPPPQPVGSLPPPSFDDAPAPESLRPSAPARARSALWVAVILALAVLAAVAWLLWFAPRA